MRSRIVRYSELDPCLSAFIDTRTPGSEEKENFTIIGPGVAENPEQHVHIDIPHGFNIGGARQPPGCVNSQHSHETAEVFVVHSGRWAFNLGADGADGSIELGPGDTISIPVHVFRGFTNVGDGAGFLFAVLGGDDPGRVTWAPYVFEAAKKYGLVLLENGRLIDTTRGETVPAGAHPMPPTTDDDVRRLRKMTAEEIAECVVRRDDLAAGAAQPFADVPGIVETAIVGGACTADGTPAGKMAWAHGFHVRCLMVEAGAESPRYDRDEPEVIMMHAGELELEWEGESTVLTPGDVATVPVGMDRRFRNRGEDSAVAYVVRGGDQPGGFRLMRKDTSDSRNTQ
ncbi:MAG: cupin domain-containing protein [Gammaproteobacteria bacterium]|nr:cupin domain-containing protein [Gammaproteobacteria bacterium]